mmetsp:Transcript_35200/g.52939  ORF Transcript_35200/g.52939 Transcript_35200/m.52939 type:complete len:136 (+) Transcript_35200:408-815(+)
MLRELCEKLTELAGGGAEKEVCTTSLDVETAACAAAAAAAATAAAAVAAADSMTCDLVAWPGLGGLWAKVLEPTLLDRSRLAWEPREPLDPPEYRHLLAWDGLLGMACWWGDTDRADIGILASSARASVWWIAAE